MYFEEVKRKSEIEDTYENWIKMAADDAMRDINEEYGETLKVFHEKKSYENVRTSQSPSGIEMKINKILKWAEYHPIFDPKFVLSLKSTFDKWGTLSALQENSLNRIVKKFKIRLDK